MGAFLRFKRATGTDVSAVKEWTSVELCTLLWCCVASACKHDGVEFGMTLEDFADSLAPDELTGWSSEALNGGQGDEATKVEKKSEL